MRCLTVQQPWAWAIVFGGKDVENRTQAWSYRGPLAIHAGARSSERGWSSPLVKEAINGTSVQSGWATLLDVHRCEPGCCESAWAESSYTEHGGRRRGDITHLILERPRLLERPLPARGALGLWKPDPDLEEALNDPARA